MAALELSWETLGGALIIGVFVNMLTPSRGVLFSAATRGWAAFWRALTLYEVGRAIRAQTRPWQTVATILANGVGLIVAVQIVTMVMTVSILAERAGPIDIMEVVFVVALMAYAMVCIANITSEGIVLINPARHLERWGPRFERAHPDETVKGIKLAD